MLFSVRHWHLGESFAAIQTSALCSSETLSPLGIEVGEEGHVGDLRPTWRPVEKSLAPSKSVSDKKHVQSI